MKERPILFSMPMVLALLAGTKTQTRRALKIQTSSRPLGWGLSESGDRMLGRLRCPYGAVGDRLWVRETFVPHEGSKHAHVHYRADHPDWTTGSEGDIDRWKPSIFMPRWASRITLEITDVRVERVQDISEADVKAEGVSPVQYDLEGDCWTATEDARLTPHKIAYQYLWGQINGFESWDTNPWVWAISFRRLP